MAFLAAAAPALGALGTLASVAGTAVSAIGSYQSSKYQAKVAEMNQRIAQDNARRTEQDGEIAAQRQDMQNRAVMGQVEAAQGASGLSVNSGSSSAVRTSAARLARQDTQTLRHNYRLRAYASKVDATNFGSQAALARNQATSSLLAGFIGGATSLLSGASQFGEKWGTFKTKGSNYGNIGGLYDQGF